MAVDKFGWSTTSITVEEINSLDPESIMVVSVDGDDVYTNTAKQLLEMYIEDEVIPVGSTIWEACLETIKHIPSGNSWNVLIVNNGRIEQYHCKNLPDF